MAIQALPPIPAPLDLTGFFAEHGRWPRIGDSIAPWRYRGWLLPYVIDIHAMHPDVPDRWGYLLATMEAGRLLADPIPRMNFESAGSPERKPVLSSIEKWVHILDSRVGGWSSFLRLVEWLAYALAVNDVDPELGDKANEALYRGVNIGPLLTHPSDYLGAILADHRGGAGKAWNPNAFYPTPHNVVEMMTLMTFHDAKDDGRDPRSLSVCDPCVGTGRMLLHASNHSLNLYGQDIDGLVCLITKINGALYAPWMVRPLPASVLGVRPIADPPPAPLPVPVEFQPPEGADVYRVDGGGQGLLFDFETEKRKRRKK